MSNDASDNQTPTISAGGLFSGFGAEFPMAFWYLESNRVLFNDDKLDWLGQGN